MRVHHPGARYYDCPVPDEVLERLRRFRDENGVRWKSKLRALWTSGEDSGLLRQARNYIGPARIDKIVL
jgi:hypothetical protein